MDQEHKPTRSPRKSHNSRPHDGNTDQDDHDKYTSQQEAKDSQIHTDSPKGQATYIDNFNRKIDHFQEIEIPKRGLYPHHVEVTDIGSLLTWTFSTRRKNIAFGLFYQPLVSSHKILPDQYKIVFQNISEEDFKVTPGPMDKTIIEPPKSLSKDSIQSHDISDKVSIASSTKGKLNILKKISSASLSKNSRRLQRDSTLNLGHDPTISTPDEVEDSEPTIPILPIQKYESYRYQVIGYLRVPLPGTYIFVFDNSFSMHTSKQVFYHIEKKPASLQIQEKSSHTWPKEAFKSASSSPISLKSESDISIATWLLKRNKSRIQGWTKRWVEIRKGILSWYEEPGGELHESIPLASCMVTKIPDRRKLIFDSGTAVFYFQALNEQDYVNWVDIIVSFKNMKYDKTFLSVMSELPKKASEMVAEMTICKDKIEECTNIASEIANRSEEKLNLKEEKISEQVASIISLLSESIDKLKRVLEQTNSQFILLNTGIKRGSSGRIKASHGRFLSMAHRREKSVDSLGPDAFFDADDVIDIEGLSSSDEDDSSLIEDEQEIEPSLKKELPETTDIVPYQLPTLPKGNDMIIPVPDISLPKDDIIRRTSLPSGMVENTASFVSILRKNIGKDFSGISMPVCVNDPLNVLQRLCEEMEYSNLLVKACHLDDPLHRLALVAAFAVSGYAFTKYRAERKPFNPLLGETFECVRKDLGFSFIAEKVSHQPPVMACYATGGNEHQYEFWQDVRVKSKFWGKSMEFSPIGHCYLRMRGDYYSWKKVISCIRNIYGTPWVEHYGEMKITNHSTGDQCVLFFRKERGFFVSSSDNSVDGLIQDKNGNIRYKLKGNWSECLYLFEGDGYVGDKRRIKSSTQLDAKSDQDSGIEAYSDTNLAESLSECGIRSQLLWKVNPIPPMHQLSYGYTSLSFTLNEMLSDALMNHLPPTDTRRRPDQRAYEHGDVGLAEIIKKKLENMQRSRRRLLDSESHPWKPKWFIRMIDPITHNEYYQFTGGYWEHCKNADFINDLNLFPSGLEEIEDIDNINEDK